mmetsp:Transcript_14714/g.28837  ORF Transcript_14714/g.28837 Transcript_14714/m.28837 type:complete len:273 (-) Transcript_14714:629-1447(-)
MAEHQLRCGNARSLAEHIVGKAETGGYWQQSFDNEEVSAFFHLLAQDLAPALPEHAVEAAQSLCCALQLYPVQGLHQPYRGSGEGATAQGCHGGDDLPGQAPVVRCCCSCFSSSVNSTGGSCAGKSVAATAGGLASEVEAEAGASICSTLIPSWEADAATEAEEPATAESVCFSFSSSFSLPAMMWWKIAESTSRGIIAESVLELLEATWWSTVEITLTISCLADLSPFTISSSSFTRFKRSSNASSSNSGLASGSVGGRSLPHRVQLLPPM